MTLKRIQTLILFTCMFLLHGSLFPQQFGGGILVGGVISQVDGDSWVGYSKFGAMAGAFVDLELSPHSSFQLEMMYIQKGSKKPSYYQQNDFHDYLLRLHYLEIPLLFQYTFLKRIQLEAGPAADILLGFQEQVDGQEVPNDYPLRRVTLAGIVGASGYITKHFKATFRFNYSLLSIREPKSYEHIPEAWRKILFEVGQFNNVLSLSLSYQFKGRKNW